MNDKTTAEKVREALSRMIELAEQFAANERAGLEHPRNQHYLDGIDATIAAAKALDLSAFEDEARDHAKLIARLEQSMTAACDPECEGRCRECPADAVREAITVLRGHCDSCAPEFGCWTDYAKCSKRPVSPPR